MIGPLTEITKIIRVKAAVAAGQTAQKATIVDTAGYDGVVFIAILGDVDNGSVVTLKAAVDDVNNTSGMTALTGTGATITATATSADDKLLIVDVQQPVERYVEAQLTRTTADAEIDGIIAILYKASTRPVTADAGVVSQFAYPPRVAVAS